MNEIKKEIEDLMKKVEKGEINFQNAWDKIQNLKEQYIKEYSEQSWHSYIGHKFQKFVKDFLRIYIKNLRDKNENLNGIIVVDKRDIKEIKEKYKIKRSSAKLSVKTFLKTI